MKKQLVIIGKIKAILLCVFLLFMIFNNTIVMKGAAAEDEDIADISGVWSGNWYTGSGSSGTSEYHLTQTDSSVTGYELETYYSCSANYSVSGNVNLDGTVIFSKNTASSSWYCSWISQVTWTGTLSEGNTKITGAYSGEGGSGTFTLTSEKNQPPIAQFTYSPSDPIVDVIIRFDGSASRDNNKHGRIESYEWDFGDGTSASEKIATHAYKRPLFYIVNLTVIDDEGLKSHYLKSVPVYFSNPTMEIANCDEQDRIQLYKVIKQVLDIKEAREKLLGVQDQTVLNSLNVLLEQIHPDKMDADVQIKDMVKELSFENEVIVGGLSAVGNQGFMYIGLMLGNPVLRLIGAAFPIFADKAKQLGLRIGEHMEIGDIGTASLNYPPVGRMDIIWLRPPKDRVLVTFQLQRQNKQGAMVISVGDWRNDLIIDWGLNTLTTIPVVNAFDYPPKYLLSDSNAIIDYVEIIGLHSPCEIAVYDSIGRLTGIINGTITTEIPGTVYDPENEMVVIYSPADQYNYEVVGLEQGTYSLRVVTVKNGESTDFIANNVSISKDQKHRYNINWTSLGKGENGTNILMDTNGDGKFEQNITTNDIFQPTTDNGISTTGKKTPGFEIIIIIGAMALVLFWKRKRFM
ncbi:MAG: PKD domain-containing protein [Euryarchaeota archaeon]|nr:PKD domain-containing protein [Euryarchaeota archaeon]